MATGAPVKSVQTNGVLAVPASQTSSPNTKSSAAKSPAARLKVVVRRLAPTLTEADFLNTLGEEWASGKGKVDWYCYKLGKESKDPAKPSRPSRAYMHLTHNDHLLGLSETIRNARFGAIQDAWDLASQGRPTTEFAPYGRVPGGRRRTDARQGTIDQDPEFMDFLESLANPVTIKEGAVEDNADATSTKSEKVTTTPLVQYLKEKKANKAKDTATKQAAKHARHDSQGSQATSKSGKGADGDESKRKGKESKSEKTSKEATKILKKEASQKNGPNAKKAPQESTKTPKLLGRERSGLSAAAQIQRDLGLAPAGRRAKSNADKANPEQKAGPNEAKDDIDKKPAPGTKQSTKGRHRGGADPEARKQKDHQKENKSEPVKAAPTPIILLKKQPETPSSQGVISPPSSSTPSKHGSSTAPKKHAPVAAPSPGATRAFVKHANPSQGVTEALLKEAMEKFGAVLHVEIDKRKGFAYVDFAEHSSLVKCMAANPTKVAQGTVQVLERKETRPTREAPANRGGGTPRGGRGGSSSRRGGKSAGRGGGHAAAAPGAASHGAVDGPGK